MSARLPRVVVAGTHSGVGKTTVATGLMAALAARGLRVAGFKVGPDYIDPGYHALATGRPPRNLDAFLSGPALLPALAAAGGAGSDVAVVEGVMGLFDGASRPLPDPGPVDPAPADPASTAHVAKLLDAPVVLVVDAGAMARSVAALVHGYATFDPALRLAGVVVNRVGSRRHAGLLRDALEPLGVPVLGVLHRSDDLATPSRHLGLVPAAERAAAARATVRDLGRRVAAAVDLDAVLAVARGAPPLRAPAWSPPSSPPQGAGRLAAHGPAARAVVAVAGGSAFSFSYTENRELLAAAGAELVDLDPTVDEALPEGTDALYLGGGFPETHADALSTNVPLRAAVAAHAAAGRPIHAECGGLLYLCRTLDGAPMCGVLPADAVMTGHLTLGYRAATAATASFLWPAGAGARGHEFHCSAVTPAAGAPSAWRHDDGRLEGHVAGNVHASYLHTHWAATPEIPARLVAAAARAREVVRA